MKVSEILYVPHAPAHAVVIRDLQAFVLSVSDHLDSPPSPEKTATYYQIRAHARQLAEAIRISEPKINELTE